METNALIIHPNISYTTITDQQISIQNKSVGTFGLNHTANILWDGAYLLSRYLEKHMSDNLKSRNILEFGAGIAAIPSQVACLYGGNVIATDISDTIPYLQDNIHRNSHIHMGSIAVQELDWDNIESLSRLPNLDIILCADLLYGDTYLGLAMALKGLLEKNPHAAVLMANTDRLQVRKFRKCEYMARFHFETLVVHDLIAEFNLPSNQFAWRITTTRPS